MVNSVEGSPQHLVLKGHLNTDVQARDRTRNFFDHENDA